MKISEVVAALNIMKERVGDIEVDVFTCGGLVLEVTDVRCMNKAEIGEFVILLSDQIAVSDK